MKRIVYMVFSLLIMCSFLFAEGRIETGSEEAKMVELSYWGWGPHVTSVNEEIAPAFNKINPMVKVKAEALGPWDLMDKFYVAMVSGKGAPDAAQLVRRVCAKYLISELLYDFSDFMAEHEGQFSEALNKDVTSVDGKYLGIAVDYGPSVVYYNKDLAEKLGIDVNSIVTWDDFYDMAIMITNKYPDIYVMPHYFPAGSWGSNYYRMFFQSAEANIYDDEGKVIRDNEKLRSQFEFMYKLHTNVRVLQAPTNDPIYYEMLEADRLLFWPKNSYESGQMAQQVPEMEGKIHAMPWPLWSKDAPAYTGNWGGVALVVPKKGENAEKAAEFLKFFATNTEALTGLWFTTSGVPAYKPAMEAILKTTDRETFVKGLMEAISVREVGPWNYTDWSQTEKIMGDALDAMFSGDKTPGEAWDWTEQQLIKILGR